MEKIKIDGKDYIVEDLSKEAQAQISMLKIVDSEIKYIDAKLAILKTARNAYALSLSPNLPEKEAAANRKKDIVTINGKKYSYADMSEKAVNDAMSIGIVDKKIEILNSELAIAKTARNAYIKSLQELVK